MNDFDLHEMSTDATEQTNKFRWATVTILEPLTIRFDGDTLELPISPASLANPAHVIEGGRVWCQIVGRRVIVIGTPNLREDHEAKSIGKLRSLRRLTDQENISSGAYTEIVWQDERFDSQAGADYNHTAIDVTGGLPTAMYDGLYVAVANVQPETNTTGRRILTIEVGGNRVAFQESGTPQVSGHGIIYNASALFRAEEGDRIRCMYYQSSGSGLDIISSEQTHFAITRLSV